MESEMESLFHSLIDGQLDQLEKRLLSLCSIPSFFTYHLVVSCLPSLSDVPVSEMWIYHFLLSQKELLEQEIIKLNII